MRNDWFFIALLSPALFAIVTILDDNLLHRVYKTPFFGAIISGFFALFPLLGLFFVPITIPSIAIVLLGILAGFLTLMYYLFYFKALDVEYPSVVIALFSLAPALVPFIAFFVLHEVLTLYQYVGLALILSAAFVLSLSQITKVKISKAFSYVLLAAFIYATTSVVAKFVYTEVDFWTGYVLFSLGMGLGALFLSIFFVEGREFFGVFKKTLKNWILIFIIVEIVGIGAELTNNLAVSKGPISLVRVIVEGMQPIYVLLLALLLYPFFPQFAREAAKGGKIRKFICMMIIVLGLYLIYQ